VVVDLPTREVRHLVIDFSEEDGFTGQLLLEFLDVLVVEVTPLRGLRHFHEGELKNLVTDGTHDEKQSAKLSSSEEIFGS